MSRVCELTVRADFSAAHALRNYRGKCERMHGHNFTVEVQVRGTEIDPATGMLLDFKVLKDLLKTVLEEIDHSTLNATGPFETINPSSENIANYIWERMEDMLAKNADPQARKARLSKVGISEKESQSAAWLITG